jgi:hypothetical protein
MVHHSRKSFLSSSLLLQALHHPPIDLTLSQQHISPPPFLLIIMMMVMMMMMIISGEGRRCYSAYEVLSSPPYAPYCPIVVTITIIADITLGCCDPSRD